VTIYSLIVVIAALAFLMFMAYKGHSVILFAPIAALGAVLLTVPALVAPVYTGLFMDKMVGFIKSYFPVFLLGAIFGKLMEMSGFAKSIVTAVVKLVGASRAILTIVLVGALLTYGGVSLFVVVFAVYPFAAEMFRQADIPKRLIPGTIALGAFTFTMDSLPGTPQIQNIIPTTFFKTTSYAAPVLGLIGGLVIFALGMIYLEMLTGRLPFRTGVHPVASLLSQHYLHDAMDLLRSANIPKPINSVIMSMIAFSPPDRPKNYATLRSQIVRGWRRANGLLSPIFN